MKNDMINRLLSLAKKSYKRSTLEDIDEKSYTAGYIMALTELALERGEKHDNRETTELY